MQKDIHNYQLERTKAEYSEYLNRRNSEYHSELEKVHADYSEKLRHISKRYPDTQEELLRTEILTNKYQTELAIANISNDNLKTIANLECDFKLNELKLLYEIENLKLLGEKSRPNEKNKNASNIVTQYLMLLTIPILLIFFGIYILQSSSQHVKESQLEIKSGPIEARMKFIYKTSDYISYQLPDREKVKGHVGKWYKIELKNAYTKELILFPIHEYFMPGDNDTLLNSLNKFAKTYDSIRNNYESAIFIKGTADKLGYNGKLKPPYDYREGFDTFECIPYNSEEGLYEGPNKLYSVNTNITNADLPNLRAKFLQHLFVKAYNSFPRPSILWGDVKLVVSDHERNAYLLLFVNWNKEIHNTKNKGNLTNNNANYYIALALITIGIIFLLFFFWKKK